MLQFAGMNKTALETADLFGVSRETIRKWVLEFEPHFSESVRVDAGQQRMFTPDDLEIVGLIAALKAEGKRFPDIHKALENGERGSIPIPPESALVSKPNETEIALVTRIDQLEIELKTLRDAEAQNRLLKEQLAEARAKIEDLSAAKAVLEYRLNASKGSE